MTIKEIIAKRDQAAALITEANNGMNALLATGRGIADKEVDDLEYQQTKLADSWGDSQKQ